MTGRFSTFYGPMLTLTAQTLFDTESVCCEDKQRGPSPLHWMDDMTRYAPALLISGLMLASTSTIARPPGMAGLAQMDSNQDQIISQSEWDQSRDELFQRLDTNGNGFIEPEERQAHREQIQNRMRQHQQQRVMQADSDGDQRISQQEFAAMGHSRFSQLDTNSDGQITQDEREAFKQSMRERHGRR